MNSGMCLIDVCLLQARVVALESALPPLRVAAKRLRFTGNSSKRKRAAESGAAAGIGCWGSQLLADIALEGAVSYSTDATAAAASVKPGALAPALLV